MNTITTQNRPQGNVDDLLKSFFKKEMPDPWPEFFAPTPKQSASSKRSWFLFHGRLALVASVALIFFGYHSVAPLFQTEQEDSLPLEQKLMIGSKIGVKKNRELTPRGAEALLWEETIPGARPTHIISVQEIKGPPKR